MSLIYPTPYNLDTQNILFYTYSILNQDNLSIRYIYIYIYRKIFIIKYNVIVFKENKNDLEKVLYEQKDTILTQWANLRKISPFTGMRNIIKIKNAHSSLYSTVITIK